MPLSPEETNPEGHSLSVSRHQTSVSPFTRNSPTSSRLTGVLEMLRVARETREGNEHRPELSFVESTNILRRGTSTASPIHAYRSISSSSSATIPSPVLAGRRREGPFPYVARERPHYRVQTPSSEFPLQPHSEGIDSPAMSSSNLLRRELDGDDFPSRLDNFRSNAVSIHESLDAVTSEVTQPFIHNRRDSFSSRNHHRHSSMSTSPRILETVNAPSPSIRRTESEKARRLEDVLFFLDMQRLPSSNGDTLLSSSHVACPYVAESSWLRPGRRYHGVQTVAGEVPNLLSSLARQLRAAQFTATKEWKVEVIIDQVDYSNMSIAGSMKAYDLADSVDPRKVTTFWTGEASNPFQLI